MKVIDQTCPCAPQTCRLGIEYELATSYLLLFLVAANAHAIRLVFLVHIGHWHMELPCLTTNIKLPLMQFANVLELTQATAIVQHASVAVHP